MFFRRAEGTDSTSSCCRAAALRFLSPTIQESSAARFSRATNRRPDRRVHEGERHLIDNTLNAAREVYFGSGPTSFPGVHLLRRGFRALRSRIVAFNAHRRCEHHLASNHPVRSVFIWCCQMLLNHVPPLFHARWIVRCHKIVCFLSRCGVLKLPDSSCRITTRG